MNKIICITALLFCITFPGEVWSQETLHGNTNSWFLLLNRFKISEKWSVTNEVHERTGKFLHEQGQFLLRPSVDYHVNNNLEFSLGYSFIQSQPYSPYPLPIPKNENNIWQQALMKFDVGKVHFQNRFRQENRWINHVSQKNGEYFLQGNDYANRFRYRITGTFDLVHFKKPGRTLFFNGFDELWFNQDAQLRPTSFARNWLYLGIGYRLDKNTSIQSGYMDQWDKVGEGFIQSDIIQFTFQKNFDFSPKKI